VTLSPCTASATNASNSSTGARAVPVAGRRTYHCRSGRPPPDRDLGEEARLELELDGDAGLERHAEAGADRLLDRAVGYADIVVSFLQDGIADDELLDAELVLRPTLEHPDLAPFIDDEGGISLEERGSEWHVRIPGRMSRSHALEIEEAIWERMHFASHLRSERLGEFTLGTELHRSESLALVQLLILYHLVTARASLALGAERAREQAVEISAA
jgi:hypothetical protein